jgi:hypothetical protein
MINHFVAYCRNSLLRSILFELNAGSISRFLNDSFSPSSPVPSQHHSSSHFSQMSPSVAEIDCCLLFYYASIKNPNLNSSLTFHFLILSLSLCQVYFSIVTLFWIASVNFLIAITISHQLFSPISGCASVKRFAADSLRHVFLR